MADASTRVAGFSHELPVFEVELRTFATGCCTQLAAARRDLAQPEPAWPPACAGDGCCQSALRTLEIRTVDQQQCAKCYGTGR
jgi:hypothetical protein